jgi:hypothetical protein
MEKLREFNRENARRYNANLANGGSGEALNRLPQSSQELVRDPSRMVYDPSVAPLPTPAAAPLTDIQQLDRTINNQLDRQYGGLPRKPLDLNRGGYSSRETVHPAVAKKQYDERANRAIRQGQAEFNKWRNETSDVHSDPDVMATREELDKAQARALFDLGIPQEQLDNGSVPPEIMRQLSEHPLVQDAYNKWLAAQDAYNTPRLSRMGSSYSNFLEAMKNNEKPWQEQLRNLDSR